MSPTHAGLICCLTFVTLEAFQAVYLGSVFQRADSFVVGSLVFGISVVGCTLATAIMRPYELLAAVRAWRIVVALNVLAAVAWIMYFFAIQLIEPAVVFTIFFGMVPLGTVMAGRVERRAARGGVICALGRCDRSGHSVVRAVEPPWRRPPGAIRPEIRSLYGSGGRGISVRAGRQGPASAARGPGMDRHGRTAGDRISSLPGSKGGSAATPLIDSGHHRLGASHRVPDATFRRSC